MTLGHELKALNARNVALNIELKENDNSKC